MDELCEIQVKRLNFKRTFNSSHLVKNDVNLSHAAIPSLEAHKFKNITHA